MLSHYRSTFDKTLKQRIMNHMTHKEAETILEALDNSIAEVEDDVDTLIGQQQYKNNTNVAYLMDEGQISLKVRYLHKQRILENGKASILLNLIRNKGALKKELVEIREKFTLQDPFPIKNFNKRLSNYFLQYVEVGLMIIDQKLNYFENQKRSYS